MADISAFDTLANQYNKLAPDDYQGYANLVQQRNQLLASYAPDQVAAVNAKYYGGASDLGGTLKGEDQGKIAQEEQAAGVTADYGSGNAAAVANAKVNSSNDPLWSPGMSGVSTGSGDAVRVYGSTAKALGLADGTLVNKSIVTGIGSQLTAPQFGFSVDKDGNLVSNGQSAMQYFQPSGGFDWNSFMSDTAKRGGSGSTSTTQQKPATTTPPDASGYLNWLNGGGQRYVSLSQQGGTQGPASTTRSNPVQTPSFQTPAPGDGTNGVYTASTGQNYGVVGNAHIAAYLAPLLQSWLAGTPGARAPQGPTQYTPSAFLNPSWNLTGGPGAGSLQ